MPKNVVTMTVEGMTCTGCAANVSRFLKGKGLTDVVVNFATKELSFTHLPGIDIDGLKFELEGIGYRVERKTLQTK